MPFLLKTETYATLVLDTWEAMQGDPYHTSLTEQVERDLLEKDYDEDGGVKERVILDEYCSELMNMIRARIPASSSYCLEIPTDEIENPSRVFSSSRARQDAERRVQHLAKRAYEVIRLYHRDATEAIRHARQIVRKHVLPSEDDHILEYGRYSLRERVLSKGVLPIHPVSALIQLCKFRLYLSEMCMLYEEPDRDMTLCSVGEESPLPYVGCLESGTEIETKGGPSWRETTRKSGYYRLGGNRLAEICSPEGHARYLFEATNYKADRDVIIFDAEHSLAALEAKAKNKIVSFVFRGLIESTDALIEAYHSIFCSLAGKKAQLEGARRLAASKIADACEGTCVHVGASESERRSHYSRLSEEVSYDLVARESRIGAKIFHNACVMAGIAKGETDIDVANTILNDLYEEQREVVCHTDSIKLLERMSCFQVLASERDARAHLNECLNAAFVMAKPPLSPRFSKKKELGRTLVLVPEELVHFWDYGREAFGFTSNESLDRGIECLLGENVTVKEEGLLTGTLFMLRFSALVAIDEMDEIQDDRFRKAYEALVEAAIQADRKDLIPHLVRFMF